MYLEGQLETQGFVKLPGVVTSETLQRTRACIRKDSVNYHRMTRLLPVLLHGVNRRMGKGWDLTPTKYRVSDTDNKVDASTFHRDCFALPGTEGRTLTCVVYLDNAVMEVIPGSHRLACASTMQALSLFRRGRKIAMRPGDILVFYSTLLHRGVFDIKSEHRRLIQIFACARNAQEYQAVCGNIINVPGNEQHQGKMKSWGTTSLFNLAGTLNAGSGYGVANKHPFHDFCRRKGWTNFSSEGLTGRVFVSQDAWQPINKYIMVQPQWHDLPPCHYEEWKDVFYYRQFRRYAAYATICSLCTLVIAWFLIRKMQQRLKSDTRPKARR
jgi:hypothetical protein